MIQRIQSVLILLAGAALGMEFVFPFATSGTETTGFFSDTMFNISDSPLLLGFVVAGIVLSIIAIALFKNRKLQMIFTGIGALLCIAIPVIAYVLFSQNQSNSTAGISLGIGAFLPILSGVLLIVANRYIHKDENLVKSMDRLR